MARTKRKVNPIQPVSAPAAPKQRIYRAGGYIRLSVEDSGRPGADTIEMQQVLIQGYIERQADMEFCGLFCDNGQTGTNFARPSFERLMEEVRAGRIDCIVVKDLSRFGRNYRETGNYLERIFPFLDVRFVAVNDHFDTLTAERSSDGYIVPLKNIINEVYSKDISRKSASALAVKQKNGEFIGTWAAYGYQKCAADPHRIEPDPETAPVVRDIFRWWVSGMPYRGITRKLNELGIPSPSRYHYLKGDAKSERYANAVWRQQVVKQILTNEVYLGHMVQGRKRGPFYEGKKQSYVPKEDWVIVRDTHEALIDEDTFRRSVELAEEAKAAYQERLGIHDGLGGSENILRGLVYCADCKRPMVRYKSVTCNGTKLAYVFICPTHADHPAACPKKYLHETELNRLLWDVLRRQIALAGDLKLLAQKAYQSPRAASGRDALRREVSAARQKLERAGRLYDSLYQNYVDKLMTEQEYREMKARYQADQEQARALLEELERREQEQPRQTVQNPWLAAFGRFQSAEQLTGEMARALIERVEIDRDDRISVKLRYQDEYERLLAQLDAAGEGAAV